MAGFLDRSSNFDGSRNSIFSVIQNRLKDLSNFGVRYEDKIIKNSMALGVVEEQHLRKGGNFDEAGLYAMAMADIGSKKADVYTSKDYKDRRAFLRAFAMNGEVQWILDTVTDECIVQDDRQMFCYPLPISEDLADDVRTEYDSVFNRVYNLFRFADDITAWQYMQKLLIDGLLAFEIVWDDQAKNIIGFKELDPASLTELTEKTPDGKFEQVWYQNYEDVRLRKRLLDSQVIYISYAKDNFSRLSYTDRLVRSFNLLRIMEHTRVIWAIMNSSYRLKMIVPIGSKSEQKAKQSLGEIASTYKEDVQLNYDTGELSYNGKPHIPFFRNYIYPNKNGETVEMSTLAYEGPDMSDMSQLAYFYDKLKTDSKIPFARYDKATGGGQALFGTSQMDHEEVRFSKFIKRLRSMFQEVLQKPMYLQMIRKFKELEDDAEFKTQVGVKFNSENWFEKLREMEVMKQTSDFINDAMSVKTIRDGEEMPFWHPKLLIEKYMNVTSEELAKNEEYWKKYGTKTPLGDMGFQGDGGSFGSDNDMGGDMGGLPSGPPEDFGGEDDLGAGAEPQVEEPQAEEPAEPEENEDAI